MKNDKVIPWVNCTIGSPKIEGNLEISRCKSGIFIGGDPDALRSFAKLLNWLANIRQDSMSTLPDGERCHVHLHAGQKTEALGSLTSFSEETELCRLDAKGTGKLPEKYYELHKARAIKGKCDVNRVKVKNQSGQRKRAEQSPKKTGLKTMSHLKTRIGNDLRRRSLASSASPANCSTKPPDCKTTSTDGTTRKQEHGRAKTRSTSKPATLIRANIAATIR